MLLVLLLLEVLESLLLGHKLLLLHLNLLLLPGGHLPQLLDAECLTRARVTRVHLPMGNRPIMHGDNTFVSWNISHIIKLGCFRTEHF